MTTEHIAHYGVLGMRWGHRKAYEEDRVISRETTFQNISAGKRDAKGYLYVSHLDEDNKKYREVFAGQLQLTSSETIFENVFKPKKDLKIASERTSLEAFKAVFDKDPQGAANSLAKIAVETSLILSIAKRMNMDATGPLAKVYAKKGELNLTKSNFKLFDRGMVSDTPLKRQYFDYLLKKGYDGVTDLNDAKSGYSKDPIVFFKGTKALKLEKSIPFTKEEMDVAVERYWQWQLYGK